MLKRQKQRAITDIHALTANPQNANRGTARGRALLRESLTKCGAGRSVLVDRDGRIIAGNKTVEAAATLGLPIRVVETAGDELVVVHRTDLNLVSDERARALALADNRVAELDLEWDPEMLKQHLADGIDLKELWTGAELERLLGEGLHPGITDEDHTIAPRATDIVAGELFELGRHRLLCGDATKAHDVTRLLAGATPVLMITDPPYGVSYDPAWRSRAAPGQRTAVGVVRNDDRVDWTEAFRHFPGNVAYVWHAGLHAGTVANSLIACDFAVRSQIIWAKQHFAMSRGDYHWQHEPCWYAVRRGQTSHWQGDRTQSTVWSVPNLNPLGGDRDGENAVTGHGTQKPVRLFERAILNHTTEGDPLYDPFLGSGTALIAAEKTGRTGFALERVFAESMRAWERSKADTTKRRQRQSARDGAGANSGGGNHTVAEVVVETKHGDPRYLETARKAMGDLRSIWGLDAPQQVDISRTDPYAGLTEAELMERIAEQDALLTGGSVAARQKGTAK